MRTIKNPVSYHHIRNATISQQVPPKLNALNHNMLVIEQTKNPKTKSPNNKLLFGKEFSDHLLEIDWTNDYGWHDPMIKPYGYFQLDPAASVLHYALEAFEGTLIRVIFHYNNT